MELARGRRDNRRDFRDDFRDGRDRRRDFRPPSTGYRVIVKGLPHTASWQDLKDHFRTAAPPLFTDVIRERDGATGVVEFETAEDMDRAIDRLDNTEFKNKFDSGVIKVMEDRDPHAPLPRGRGPPRGGRYRSRSPPGRRFSRSPPRRRYSRSPPPRRRYSRSPSPPTPRRDSRSPSPPGRRDSRSPPRGDASPRGRSYSRSPPREDDRYAMDRGE